MALVHDDIYKLCEHKDILINWLREKEWIANFQGATCEICRIGKLRLQEDKLFSQDGIYWRCLYRSCGKKISIRKGSWFEKSHLSLAKITKLTYYWVWKYPEELVRHELKIGSSHTAVDWFNFAREVCVDILEMNSEQIGGPGEIIEIDESKFGKVGRYLHLTVNHSIHFKDSETGACTNTIEATWGAVKRSLPRYGTKKTCTILTSRSTASGSNI